MQTSIFDKQNVCKAAYQKSLKEFNLQEALVNIGKWERALDAPADLPARKEALQIVQRQLSEAGETSLQYLATLKFNFEASADSFSFLIPLKNDHLYFLNGLHKAIYQRLAADPIEYIIPDIHPAGIFVEVGEYSKAIKSVDQYIVRFGEDAYLRQLQGFAFFKQGQEKSAMIAFCYAIFNDPLRCSMKYLYPRDYERKFLALLEKKGQNQSAWLSLAFALWQEGLTFITPEATEFEAELKRKVADYKATSKSEPAIKLVHFNRLLYLAEMARLRSGRKNETEEIKRLREQMRDVNMEMFNSYLSVLRAFEH